MSKQKWHSGPPPHVGWWNCKDPTSKLLGDWRFWNGRSWSLRCLPSDSLGELMRYSSMPSFIPYHLIRWCDYYPANARVPRRKP